MNENVNKMLTIPLMIYKMNVYSKEEIWTLIHWSFVVVPDAWWTVANVTVGDIWLVDSVQRCNPAISALRWIITSTRQKMLQDIRPVSLYSQ